MLHSIVQERLKTHKVDAFEVVETSAVKQNVVAGAAFRLSCSIIFVFCVLQFIFSEPCGKCNCPTMPSSRHVSDVQHSVALIDDR